MKVNFTYCRLRVISFVLLEISCSCLCAGAWRCDYKICGNAVMTLFRDNMDQHCIQWRAIAARYPGLTPWFGCKQKYFNANFCYWMLPFGMYERWLPGAAASIPQPLSVRNCELMESGRESMKPCFVSHGTVQSHPACDNCLPLTTQCCVDCEWAAQRWSS